MKRFWRAALAMMVLSAACKVQRTPEEYIDHRIVTTQPREAAAEELNARLLAIAEALARGDLQDVLTAMPVASDAHVYTASAAEPALGSDEIAAAVEEYLRQAEPLRLRDLFVWAGPRGTTGWFRAEMEQTRAAGPATLRVTGVLLRGNDGEWELVQAHVSEPRAEPAAVLP